MAQIARIAGPSGRGRGRSPRPRAGRGPLGRVPPALLYRRQSMGPNGASDRRHEACRLDARAGRLDGDRFALAAQRRLVSTPGASDPRRSRQPQRTDLAPKHVSRRPSVNDPGQRRPLLLVARSPVVVSSLRALHLPRSGGSATPSSARAPASQCQRLRHPALVSNQGHSAHGTSSVRSPVPQNLWNASDQRRRRRLLGLKQANGAELWAKIVACGLIGSGPARLSLVRERFGEGLRCVEFTDVEGGWFLGG